MDGSWEKSIRLGENMRKYMKLLALPLLALLSMESSANSFQGTIWSLSYQQQALPDSNPFTETYRVSLNVDTSGYTGPGSYLDQVAIKVGYFLTGASLFSAPGGSSSWSLEAGGVNADGCSGSGVGFVCSDSLSILNDGKGVAVGSAYSWVFDLTMLNTAVFPAFNNTSVKGRFVDEFGNKAGDLVSETITSPAPEPEIYAMLLAGLGMLGFLGRRKRLMLSATQS